MAKQKVCHKFVYKLHSSILEKYNWDYTLPLKEAMKHKKDIIPLSDSQTLRFIDEFNNVNTDFLAKKIKNKIKLEKQKNSTEETRNNIKELYKQLYNTQFQKDYMCLIIDKKSHYDRANKGFYINGIKYKRFLGTNGGIKNSTIIYVSERVYPFLKERLDCGRNKNIPLVPAKLEAYQALMCSSSIPVSMPKGIIVVKDCVTHFKDNVIFVDDSESDEPVVTYKDNVDIELIDSDGYGLMSPDIARRWNGELNNNDEECLSGVNIRGLAWTKGMLFPFDFIEFAEKVAGTYEVVDAWGTIRDIRDAEVILTTSMLKLWDCYDSFEDYWSNIEKYKFKFAIAKTAPEELETERYTNYQFLQSYNLSDEDIDELIKPTLDEIEEVLGLDYQKSLLFLKGMSMSEKNVWNNTEYYVKSLMIEPKMINDPYIRSQIYRMIKKKIQQAKIGALKVNGNFAIISGDPYSLCQSMFGLEVTGLLKRGECYHKYWSDLNVDRIVCFRAPMTSHNNIRKLNVADNEYVRHWYQYINTCMLLNSWDTTCEALNGADKDSDIFFTTNNRVLLDNTRDLPCIQCVQRRAEKKIVKEKDIIKSNKNSFGDAIGSTTNIITSQICLQADFEPNSEEYKVLDYRILCGQLLQQNSIDRSKGIIAKPMPKHWKDMRACDNEFDVTIAADKKPYFFIYNYSYLKKRYEDYVEDRKINCRIRFNMDLDTLLKLDNLTDEQRDFVYYYYKYIPVLDSNCLVNKICHKVEDFDHFNFSNSEDTNFDTDLIRIPNVTYTESEKDKVEEIYKFYCQTVSEYMQQMKSDNIDTSQRQLDLQKYKQIFKSDCETVCPDINKLCNILIDICYNNRNKKQFVWDVCGETIINNMLARNNNKISFPVSDSNGDIKYRGERFRMESIILEEKGEELL